MSSVVQAHPRTLLPPLEAGQSLDQPTFHERYEAMPPETRAELVGGVVYMPSPEVFPGLWLDAEALFSGDLDRLMEVLDQGLATPEHAAFAAKLAAGRHGSET